MLSDVWRVDQTEPYMTFSSQIIVYSRKFQINGMCLQLELLGVRMMRQHRRWCSGDYQEESSAFITVGDAGRVGPGGRCRLVHEGMGDDR